MHRILSMMLLFFFIHTPVSYTHLLSARMSCSYRPCLFTRPSGPISTTKAGRPARWRICGTWTGSGGRRTALIRSRRPIGKCCWGCRICLHGSLTGISSEIGPFQTRSLAIKKECAVGTFSRRGAVASATIYHYAECASLQDVYKRQRHSLPAG